MNALLMLLILPLTLLAQTPQTSDSKKDEKTTWEKVKDTAADLGEKGLEVTQKAAASAGKTLNETREYREQRKWAFIGNYSYLDMLVPGKWGGTISYIPDASQAWELDYMSGSVSLGWLGVDIGEIQEQRVVLQWRHWGERGTFNTQYGLMYNRFDVHVGHKLLDKIVGTNTQYELMKMETMGLSWGIGNRWQTRGGFLWAVDWFQIHLPLVLLNQDSPYVDATPNEDDKHDALKTLNIIRNFPRLVALKLQLGFTF